MCGKQESLRNDVRHQRTMLSQPLTGCSDGSQGENYVLRTGFSKSELGR
jgi:hypothetical protein